MAYHESFERCIWRQMFIKKIKQYEDKYVCCSTMSTTTSDSVSGAPPRLQDDFDNVYNAEWKQSNPIPDKYPRYTNFTALTEKMESIMKEICESGKSELVTRLYNMFLQQTEDQVKNHISGNIRPIAEITNVDALIDYLCEQVVEGNYYLLHIYPLRIVTGKHVI